MPISLQKVRVFYDGLDHPECVAVHRDGSVWAGGEAGQIYRIAPDGKAVEQVAGTGGFVLGVAFAPDASWLAVCDSAKHCVWRLEVPSLRLSAFARGDGAGNALGLPNHLAFTRAGDLFVTDSGTFRKVDGRIFMFFPDGRGCVWHPGPFNFANGCALDSDESALFVNCTWLPGVEKILVTSDGSAGRRSVYARLPRSLPDGLAFDARGNLYVSCYTPSRIYKITPRRAVSVWLDDWDAHHVGNPTNLAFGGPGLRRLYVANLAQWHVSVIDTPFGGLPLPHQRPTGRSP